jgi:hypothetical protein
MKSNWRERRKAYLEANGRFRELAREGYRGLVLVASAGVRVPGERADRNAGALPSVPITPRASETEK